MKKLIVLSAIAFALCSCNNHDMLQTIFINIEHAKKIPIETQKLIPLETSDNSMIYDISSLEILDDRFIIHSRDLLRSYNRNSGKYTGDIACRGKNKHDFSYIGNLWLEGDTINIFDTNKGAIMSFSSSGAFLGSKHPFGKRFKIGEKPRQYHELPGIGIFSVNISSDGTTPSNPRFSCIKIAQKDRKAVKGREIQDPMWLPDGVFVDTANSRLLSWEPLRDTIFEVTPEIARPIYRIDFGDNAIPDNIQRIPDLIDRIESFNNKDGLPYASLIRYIQVAGNKIIFSFTCSDGSAYLACHNPQTNDTAVRHIATEDGRYSQAGFFKISGDSAYVEIRDRENIILNPFIYTVSIEDLQ